MFGGDKDTNVFTGLWYVVFPNGAWNTPTWKWLVGLAVLVLVGALLVN